MNKISDLCAAIDTLKRGEFEFPYATVKQVCSCNVYIVHRFMRLYDNGPSTDKQEPRPPTSPATQALHFGIKAVQSSEQFDSKNYEATSWS